MAARARSRAFMAKGVLGQRPKTSRGLPAGSVVKCTDNTGARTLRIIQVIGYKGRLRRVPAAAVGDMVVVSVRKGTPDMRKKIFQAAASGGGTCLKGVKSALDSWMPRRAKGAR